MIIAIYVDDVLIASRNNHEIDRLRDYLAKEFEIRDLGEQKCCLGVEFSRDWNRISLHQQGYIMEILSRFGMIDCKPAITPLDINVTLRKPEKAVEEEAKEFPFREVIGALMYLATSTRPNISHAVSQFTKHNGPIHWTAAKRVLRYLKGTVETGLTFGPSSETLKGYSDADWESCLVDGRSFTGYTFAWKRSHFMEIQETDICSPVFHRG